MGFWDISLPIFGALLAHSLVMELISFGFQAYFMRKQAKMVEEVEAKVASGEINPMEIMAKQFGSKHPGMWSGRATTASGTVHASDGGPLEHGQYL